MPGTKLAYVIFPSDLVLGLLDPSALCLSRVLRQIVSAFADFQMSFIYPTWTGGFRWKKSNREKIQFDCDCVWGERMWGDNPMFVLYRARISSPHLWGPRSRWRGLTNPRDPEGAASVLQSCPQLRVSLSSGSCPGSRKAGTFTQ